MTRTAHALALLTGAAAALTLSACGVPASGVIEAGDPATGMVPGLSVYLLSGDGLVAVPRGTSGGADADTAVRLLFAGPTEDEAPELGTALPRVASVKTELSGGLVVVEVPGVAHPLGDLAMRQVACTVEAARTGPLGAGSASPADTPASPRRPGFPGAPVPTSAPLRPGSGSGPGEAMAEKLAAGRFSVLVVGPGWSRGEPPIPCPSADG